RAPLFLKMFSWVSLDSGTSQTRRTSAIERKSAWMLTFIIMALARRISVRGGMGGVNSVLGTVKPRRMPILAMAFRNFALGGFSVHWTFFERNIYLIAQGRQRLLHGSGR